MRRTGVIDLSHGADGRLRQLDKTLIEKPEDPVVPSRLIDQHGLRTGMNVTVHVGDRRGAEPVNGRKKKKKSRRAAQPPQQIACTFFGCRPVPAGCYQREGFDFWGNPTGFDVIICPGR